MDTETMPETVASLVKKKHLTELQGKKLNPAYALKIGLRNKKNNRYPKKSLSDAEWEKRVRKDTLAAKKLAKKKNGNKKK